jgi:hypothetical protein
MRGFGAGYAICSGLKAAWYAANQHFFGWEEFRSVADAGQYGSSNAASQLFALLLLREFSQKNQTELRFSQLC